LLARLLSIIKGVKGFIISTSSIPSIIL
jgi:hypothetical protein